MGNTISVIFGTKVAQLIYGAGGAKLIAVNRGGSEARIAPSVRDFLPLRAADAAAFGAFPALTVPACGSAAADVPFQI